MELHLDFGGGREVLGVGGRGDELSVSREGEPTIEAGIVGRGPGMLLLAIDGRRHRVRYWRQGPVLHLHLRGEILRVQLEDPDEDRGSDPSVASPVLRAPMPGKVLEVLVEEGQEVSAGTPLVRLEAMKMEIDLDAPGDGVVGSVFVRAGDLVEPDAELVRLEPVDGD